MKKLPFFSKLLQVTQNFSPSKIKFSPSKIKFFPSNCINLTYLLTQGSHGESPSYARHETKVAKNQGET